MRSVVPSESATVPLPDHDPLKPVNGPDWAWLTDTDNMSAAPTPAALIACPNNLEPNNFISNFPIQMTFCRRGKVDRGAWRPALPSRTLLAAVRFLLRILQSG